MTPTRARQRLTIAAAAVLLALPLAGCAASEPEPDSSPTAGALKITCAELLPQAVVTTVKATLVPTASFTPAAGSNAAQIVSNKGVACGWTDPSGATLVIAAADITADTGREVETRLNTESVRTPALGSEGKIYFKGGDVEIITENGYWVSAVSPLFTTAAQAQSVVSSMLQALPSG